MGPLEPLARSHSVVSVIRSTGLHRSPSNPSFRTRNGVLNPFLPGISCLFSQSDGGNEFTKVPVFQMAAPPVPATLRISPPINMRWHSPSIIPNGLHSTDSCVSWTEAVKNISSSMRYSVRTPLCVNATISTAPPLRRLGRTWFRFNFFVAACSNDEARRFARSRPVARATWAVS